MDNISALVGWMAKHPDELLKIVNMEYDLNPQECLDIVQMLEADGRYDLIVVFLQAGRFSTYTREINDQFWQTLSALSWENIGNQSAIKLLKEVIRESIERDKGRREKLAGELLG